MFFLNFITKIYFFKMVGIEPSSEFTCSNSSDSMFDTITALELCQNELKKQQEECKEMEKDLLEIGGYLKTYCKNAIEIWTSEMTDNCYKITKCCLSEKESEDTFSKINELYCRIQDCKQKEIVVNRIIEKYNKD